MTLPSLNYDKKAVDTFEFELYSLEQGRGVDNFSKVGGANGIYLENLHS